MGTADPFRLFQNYTFTIVSNLQRVQAYSKPPLPASHEQQNTRQIKDFRRHECLDQLLVALPAHEIRWQTLDDPRRSIMIIFLMGYGL
jgi:hypothetical protein